MTSGSQKYVVRTFGCQMNEHDSERIAGLLQSDGMVAVYDDADADVVVLNTCCIRENADNKLYGTLGHLKTWKDAKDGRQIVVSGCLSQKDKDIVQQRAPWVDVVMGTHNIPPPRTGDPIPVTNKVPLAFFQGSIDSVVTLDQSERTFAVVNGVTPRMFVTVEGGNHFFMTDVDNPPGVNEDKAAMGLAQDLSVHSVAHWIVVWFRAAAGDAMSREALMDRGPLLEPHLKATIVE